VGTRFYFKLSQIKAAVSRFVDPPRHAEECMNGLIREHELSDSMVGTVPILCW
jgi:hypothetical protein